MSENDIQALLEEIDVRDGWEIRRQEEEHLEIDYLPARLSRLERCHQNPGIDVTAVGPIWWVGSTDNIGKGFEPENDDTRPGAHSIDCADFEDAVSLVEHGMERVEIAVGEELREAHKPPLLTDGGERQSAATSHHGPSKPSEYLDDVDVSDVLVGVLSIGSVVAVLHTIGWIAVFEFGFGTSPTGLIDAAGNGPLWAYTLAGIFVVLGAVAHIILAIAVVAIAFVLVTEVGKRVRSFLGGSDE